MIDEAGDGLENRLLAPDRHQALFHRVVRSEVARVAFHDGLLELGNAARRRVLGKVLIERRDSGLLDVLRRRKIRLSGAEVHHVHSARFELVGLGDYGGGRGNRNPGHTLGESHDFAFHNGWSCSAGL